MGGKIPCTMQWDASPQRLLRSLQGLVSEERDVLASWSRTALGHTTTGGGWECIRVGVSTADVWLAAHKDHHHYAALG